MQILWVATHEAAEQALAAAADSGNEPTTVDLSWPTMICAKCKKLAQHKLYNEDVVDVPCTCDMCLANPPLPDDDDDNCNCSGCIPEILPTMPRRYPAATILSTIAHNDRISTQARSHSEKVLIKFRKKVWRAHLSNCMFPPEVYLSDHLIKEILDRFLQLNSIKAVKTFLEPHDRLKSEGSSLFGILQALKVNFDGFAAAKKLESAVKQRANAAIKAAEKQVAKDADKGDGEIDTMGVDEAIDEDGGALVQEGEARVSGTPSTS